MKIFLSTNMFPSIKSPHLGVFIKCHVDLMKTDYNIENIIICESQKTRTIFEKIKKYIKFFFKLIYFSFKKRCDLIHAHYSFPTGFLTIIVKIITMKKMILTVHGSDVESDKFKNKILFFLNKITFLCSDIIITVSQELKNKIIIDYNINEKNINVIDMGFNENIFYPNKKDFLDNYLNIVFIGRLIDIKGLNILIESINLLDEKLKNKIRCQILGDGSSKQQYLNLIDKYKLNRNFIFKGIKKQNEIANILRKSNVVVMPSIREGFGLVALEALACGIPVIGTKVGGLKKIIKNDYNGYFINSNDPIDLKSKIELFSSKNKIKKQNCIDSVENYNMHLKVKQILQLYKKIL